MNDPTPLSAEEIDKIGQLLQKIWEKLWVQPKAESTLAKSEQGTEAELDQQMVRLRKLMEGDPQFAVEVKALAKEIDAGKLQNSSMYQIAHGNAQAFQTEVWGGIAYIGRNDIHVDAEALKKVLQELLGDYQKVNQLRVESSSQHFCVPTFLESSEFIGRAQKIDQTINSLMHGKIVTSLWGLGGCGKTVLAKKICYTDSIQKHFSGGIFWVGLGEKLSAEEGMKLLYKHLTNTNPHAFNSEDLAIQIKKYWSQQPCLVVIDNVETKEELNLFLSSAKESCKWLITTPRLLGSSETIDSIELEPMSREESLEILSYPLKKRGEFSQQKLKELSDMLYEWPVLIDIVKKQIQKRINISNYTSNLDALLDEIIEEIKELDWMELEELDQKNNIFKSLASRFKLLNKNGKEIDYFKELFIFPKDVKIPITLLEKLWDLKSGAVKRICQNLYHLSLLELCNINAIRINSRIRRYFMSDNTLKKQLSNTHKRLVEYYEHKYNLKYGDDIPDNLSDSEKVYLQRFLYSYHWKRAGKT